METLQPKIGFAFGKAKMFAFVTLLIQSIVFYFLILYICKNYRIIG